MSSFLGFTLRRQWIAGVLLLLILSSADISARPSPGSIGAGGSAPRGGLAGGHAVTRRPYPPVARPGECALVDAIFNDCFLCGKAVEDRDTYTSCCRRDPDTVTFCTRLLS